MTKDDSTPILADAERPVLRIQQIRDTPEPSARKLRNRSAPSSISEPVPLVHVTEAGFLDEILRTKYLTTFPCKVFKKKLAYFFAMRAAYRVPKFGESTDQLCRFPIVFITTTAVVGQLSHVYPFDTGAAKDGVYNEAAEKPHYLDDYELESTSEAIRGQIGWAFGNVQAYIDGELRQNLQREVPFGEFLTQSFIRIASEVTSTSKFPDSRALTIEAAVDRPVSLKKISLLILPGKMLRDDLEENDELEKALESFPMQLKTYDWQPGSAPVEYRDTINLILLQWFKDRKYL